MTLLGKCYRISAIMPIDLLIRFGFVPNQHSFWGHLYSEQLDESRARYDEVIVQEIHLFVHSG